MIALMTMRRERDETRSDRERDAGAADEFVDILQVQQLLLDGGRREPPPAQAATYPPPPYYLGQGYGQPAASVDDLVALWFAGGNTASGSLDPEELTLDQQQQQQQQISPHHSPSGSHIGERATPQDSALSPSLREEENTNHSTLSMYPTGTSHANNMGKMHHRTVYTSASSPNMSGNIQMQSVEGMAHSPSTVNPWLLSSGDKPIYPAMFGLLGQGSSQSPQQQYPSATPSPAGTQYEEQLMSMDCGLKQPPSYPSCSASTSLQLELQQQQDLVYSRVGQPLVAKTITMNWLLLVLLLFFEKCIALNIEGSTCFTNVVNKTLLRGKCMEIDDCAFAQKLLRQGKRPQNCGISRNSVFVCCPTSQNKITQRLKTKSEEKCAEYYDKRNIYPGIVGGEKAKPREFPHMTAIGFGTVLTNANWFCGGSLISEKFVLTAAHCISHPQHGVPKWVRVGDLNLKNTTEDAKPQDIEIEKIIKHPQYNSSAHYHDIALLKLKSALKFGSYVKPACLNTETNLSKAQLQAIGWGKTEFYGDTSDDLLKVFLKEVQFRKCAQVYSSARKLPRGLDHHTQICAGDPVGRDTCAGDSGGPLHFLNKGTGHLLDHFVVVGITSFGKGCGVENSAGVYTRVSSYRPWIESVVWLDE